MLDLDYLTEIYNFNHIGSDELIYFQSVKKIKNWESKSDYQKQEHRKSYLKMLEIHFKEEKDIGYISQTIVVTDRILSFLNSKQIDFRNFKSLSEDEKYLARIYYLLYYEKEFLFYKESIRTINHHIPLDTFNSLIKKIKKTSLYEESGLVELFDDYKKMILLFDNNKT
jgi:hypothetical protein